ncbi:AAA family ATPase [Streptomyces sp. SID13031]|uniref:AAA family ATPase n=1 Tax=Streptomyces sp. SID13031 TaxID=2706046 RepID=UPI0013CC7443|nr:AAA family ATPase [Streptomyces sp. SID13031]
MATAATLFDRDRELAQLVDLIGRGLAGSGEFAVIEGPAGIGKTRLLDEALSTMPRSAAAVLPVRCSQLERDATFGAVRRLFEPVIAASSPSQRRDLFAGAAAPAASLVERRTANWDVASEFVAFHALYWMVANLCQEGPQIILVDDLHWCDGPSLRFLAHLIHRSADMPLTVLMTARPADPGAETRLLDHIATEPGCLTVRLGPLSEKAALQLLMVELGAHADREFLTACYLATSGNPLLLLELTDMVASAGIEPTTGNADAVKAISSHTVARWVRNRLSPLDPNLIAVARAIAVLGDAVDTRVAYSVAQVPVDVGLDATDWLCRADIIRRSPSDRYDGVEFVHPLIRETVYNELDRLTRSRMHALAVEQLTAVGSDVEQVAAHVLLTQEITDPPAHQVLRAAAQQATSRGAPEGAVVYLRRCLREGLSVAERAGLLAELGAIAQLVDLPAAAGYLRQAEQLDGAGPRSVAMSGLLAGVLLQMGDSVNAVDTVTKAIAATDNEDAKHRLEALLLNVPILEPGWQHLVPASPPHGEVDPSAGTGRRMVDAVFSLHETFACDPAGPARAAAALSDDVLIREISGEGALVCAWLSMLAADDHSVMASLEAAIAYAHRYGSMRGVSPAYAHRGLAWLWQGQITEAEADLVQARKTVDTGSITIGRYFTGPYLAEVYIAQGRLAEAREALDWVTGGAGQPPDGPSYFYLLTDARLLRLSGDAESGLVAALRCGNRYALHGGTNPALVPWRSEAALCLDRLGRSEEGIELAQQEVSLARRWGAPRALGRSLRVLGILKKGAEGLIWLRESTKVLEQSRADLERAKSLITYGSRLHHLHQSDDAKDFLREGLELAEICGAEALVTAGRRELNATGARPRRLALTGVRSLTPSEHRIVELAAEGRTNREIAQALFITAKTVEIHLTAAYKKLDVHGRDGLAAVLNE